MKIRARRVVREPVARTKDRRCHRRRRRLAVRRRREHAAFGQLRRQPRDRPAVDCGQQLPGHSRAPATAGQARQASRRACHRHFHGEAHARECRSLERVTQLGNHSREGRSPNECAAYRELSGSDNCNGVERGPDARPIAARVRGVEAAVLPLAFAAGAAGMLAAFARAGNRRGSWARFAGLAILGLSAHCLIARADRIRAGHGAAVVAAGRGRPASARPPRSRWHSLSRTSLAPVAARSAASPEHLELTTEVVASIASWLTAAAAYALAVDRLDGEAAWALAGMVACGYVRGDGRARSSRRREARGPLSSSLGAPVLTLGTKLLLAAPGAALAAVCLTNPWLAPFAAAPLLLLRQWFEIPLLEQQARRDAKTGLFNARYFELAVERELGEAKVGRRAALGSARRPRPPP